MTVDDIIRQLNAAKDAVARAREHLGSFDTSYGWNDAYSKVQAAELQWENALLQLRQHIDNLKDKPYA